MSTYDEVLEQWQTAWPDALACWSRFTKLNFPHYCATEKDEKKEGLTGSFAMIRFADQVVVVSLRQVIENKIEWAAKEILAHEIGHHVYCPSNFADYGRVLARMRRGLPTRETMAPFLFNLYADLLINDRLQREHGLNMAGVYEALNAKTPPDAPESRIWTFYMRLYEVLWSRGRGTLARGKIDARLNSDAGLGARLLRVYKRDWLEGAGRFAALCLPYLLEDAGTSAEDLLKGWGDTLNSGAGSQETPGGLTEIDDGEANGAIHPSLDPELSGIDETPLPKEEITDEVASGTGGYSAKGGNRQHKEYRGPGEYGELLRLMGLKVNDHQAAARYYRERAIPHLVPFPTKKAPQSEEPLPEGVETWSVGEEMGDVDWLESVLVSPQVVPGITTVRRTYGTSPGSEPTRIPLDLYIGVDCSGSMPNPQSNLSYPILAGAVMALSALRVGARVMVCLSGEPGRSLETKGFVSSEQEVLRVLTDYLGTGYSYGIGRLKGIFDDRRNGKGRPAHILIITDHDIFSMLREAKGWDLAKEAITLARGGGTYILHMTEGYAQPEVDRMKGDGYHVHHVQDWEGVLDFARAFVKARYGDEP